VSERPDTYDGKLAYVYLMVFIVLLIRATIYVTTILENALLLVVLSIGKRIVDV